MSESSLRRSIASRKPHMGIITRKKGEFENIRIKLVDEITSEDKLTVETLLESLEEKAKVLDQLNLEFLNGTENTEEAMEAEIFTQDENDVRLQSLMKQMRKWLTGISDSTDDDDVSITERTTFDYSELNYLPLTVSTKIGNLFLTCSKEQSMITQRCRKCKTFFIWRAR